MRCIICGHDTVYWIDSYTSEDYGVEEDGVVHEFECKNCGSEYSIFVPASAKPLNEENNGTSNS